jgi:hypothetical protein
MSDLPRPDRHECTSRSPPLQNFDEDHQTPIKKPLLKPVPPPIFPPPDRLLGSFSFGSGIHLRIAELVPDGIKPYRMFRHDNACYMLIMQTSVRYLQLSPNLVRQIGRMCSFSLLISPPLSPPSEQQRRAISAIRPPQTQNAGKARMAYFVESVANHSQTPASGR